ncbi:hypothetical protein FISHEDRAFT_75657 [Fistulina hepatica ATCC 64428]|uniref:Uncharacterized protein n=1 Tax=Fistulina hepatica ATCC 64428 TaxID=1128425 RepID=A0A0D7A5X9_9AGAR|nr:hypothetical protein FISHEDRAFT_75657 [Fistulina hepatica ATCC 64428]
MSYRSTNMLYGELADMTRARLRLTHHACKRAERLKLAVNIPRALACPHSQVSVIPLPVIDTTPSPTELAAADDLYLAPQNGSGPTLRRRAARRYRSASCESSGSEYSLPSVVEMDIGPSSGVLEHHRIPQIVIDESSNSAHADRANPARPVPDVPVDMKMGAGDDPLIDDEPENDAPSSSSQSSGPLMPDYAPRMIIRRKRCSASDLYNKPDAVSDMPMKSVRKMLRLQTHPYARQ